MLISKRTRTGWTHYLMLIDLDDYQTYKVRTCSGGYHCYFKYDERFKTFANVLPGVDVRNDNVCVFAGERYVVVNDVELADMPEELYEALHRVLQTYISKSYGKDRNSDNHQR
ncbi:unnamed protein product [Phytophthora lilii]|uniref:Unnamed protein product n=1 Tax=Phytophthora lilii TaxID=2077276 RepID=A0A9W6XGP8_9STRA|nr:unnamed protein product [Phytophthora lilii]